MGVRKRIFPRTGNFRSGVPTLAIYVGLDLSVAT